MQGLIDLVKIRTLSIPKSWGGPNISKLLEMFQHSVTAGPAVLRRGRRRSHLVVDDLSKRSGLGTKLAFAIWVSKQFESGRSVTWCDNYYWFSAGWQ